MGNPTGFNKRITFLKNKRFSDAGCRRAFTLTETILVVTLVSSIGVALYQSLADGIKIWQRVRQEAVDDDVLIFLDYFTQDLRRAVVYSLLDIEKRENRLAFPAVVTVREDAAKHPGIAYVEQIGKVEYYFDRDQSAVFRRQANYGQALKKKYEPARRMVSSIAAARFDYAYSRAVVSNAVNSEQGFLPAAVKIELEILEPGGQTRYIQRLINIPIATIL